MQFKRIKRAISGVLLLDKPYGVSSNTALQHARRLFQAEKAGHTGNLDPMATGLLPVCFGEATKFSQTLLDADKAYLASIKFGITTETGDAEGAVLKTLPVSFSRPQLDQILLSLTGNILQIPPMYSALKHQGKALYTYARAGVEIERQAREVSIYQLDVRNFSGDELDVLVRCSKGTYIRVLAEDMGAALGCGAHLKGLRRTVTGGFELEGAVTLDQLENMDMAERDACLLPTDCLLANLDKVELDADSAFYIQRGQPVWLPKQGMKTQVRLYGPGGVFIGLGESASDGKIAPKRLVNL